MRIRGHDGGALGPIDRLFGRGTLIGLGETDLLGRFAADRDEAAFAALVERHGPMVLGVCRRILNDGNDVDDAFQATFLVLVRRAGSIRRGVRLGPWLYGVALRVARKSRALSARRQARLKPLEGIAEGPPSRDLPFDDLRGPIDDEIARLPEALRRVVVLCYLEGCTHDEAARRLAWPVGTVRSRLARARSTLKGRLARRGLAPTAGSLAAFFVAERARAALPAALIAATTRSALLLSAGRTAAVGVAALGLSQTIARTTLMAKFSLLGATLAAAGTIAAFVAGPGLARQGDDTPAQGAAPSPIAGEPAASTNPAVDDDRVTVEEYRRLTTQLAQLEGQILGLQVQHTRLSQRLASLKIAASVDPRVIAHVRKIDGEGVMIDRGTNGKIELDMDLAVIDDSGKQVAIGQVIKVDYATSILAVDAANIRLGYGVIDASKPRPGPSGVGPSTPATVPIVGEADPAIPDGPETQAKAPQPNALGVVTRFNGEYVSAKRESSNEEELKVGDEVYVMERRSRQLVAKFTVALIQPDRIESRLDGFMRGQQQVAIGDLVVSAKMLQQFPTLTTPRVASGAPPDERAQRGGGAEPGEAPPDLQPGGRRNGFGRRGSRPAGPSMIRHGLVYISTNAEGNRMSIYSIANRDWTTFEAPAGVQLTPLMGEKIIAPSLGGAEIKQVAVYLPRTSRWYPFDLPETARDASPVVLGNTCVYIIGRNLIAFSESQEKWAVQRAIHTDRPQPIVDGTTITVQDGPAIHLFYSGEAKWDTITPPDQP